MVTFAIVLIGIIVIAVIDSQISNYFKYKVLIEKERTRKRRLDLCVKLGCTEKQLEDSLNSAFEYNEYDEKIQIQVEK